MTDDELPRPTCFPCREAGRKVYVEPLPVTFDNRSVSALVRVKCPECGWIGGPYSL